ncbi:MAG TPA: (2Fe-2S) ferredoxin domain-containing protein [Candidatus Omnitrophota bacterium]|nr:(2Fe-2S) ferredoxin domain-containing protein [Candidatus Omnitrophota bacterium]
MKEKLNKDNLGKIKEKILASGKNWIKVGFSTCGIAAGAQEVYDVLCEEARKHNADVDIKKCGCVGMCSVEPLVEVCVKGLPRVFYGKVDRETAIKIVEKHVCGHLLVNDHICDVKIT